MKHQRQRATMLKLKTIEAEKLKVETLIVVSVCESVWR